MEILGKRATAIQFPERGTPAGFATPRPTRRYDAMELGFNRRFVQNWTEELKRLVPTR